VSGANLKKARRVEESVQRKTESKFGHRRAIVSTNGKVVGKSRISAIGGKAGRKPSDVNAYNKAISRSQSNVVRAQSAQKLSRRVTAGIAAAGAVGWTAQKRSEAARKAAATRARNGG
jgi:hypothetical protein